MFKGSWRARMCSVLDPTCFTDGDREKNRALLYSVALHTKLTCELRVKWPLRTTKWTAAWLFVVSVHFLWVCLYMETKWVEKLKGCVDVSTVHAILRRHSDVMWCLSGWGTHKLCLDTQQKKNVQESLFWLNTSSHTPTVCQKSCCLWELVIRWWYFVVTLLNSWRCFLIKVSLQVRVKRKSPGQDSSWK